MESGKRGDGWPGPEAQARHRLPRTEDLPSAEQGYDREKVNEAFDAFYRHIAQLDSTLRALEAVEVFRDQAGELRKELRALKAAGWTQQPWQSYAPARVSPGLPESLPRFAIEAAFLIIVAVVVAVAGFDRLSIVLVMALAWSIVGVVEWAASRERFARRRIPAPAPARPQSEPALAPLRIVTPRPASSSARAERWADPAVAEPPDAGEEMTGVGALARESEPEPLAGIEAAGESEPVVADSPPAAEAEAGPTVEPEAEAEPELEAGQHEFVDEEPDEQHGHWSWAADAAVERAREHEQADQEQAGRRRWWRRNREHDAYRFDPTQPSHVRVLPPEPSFDEQFPVDRSPQAIDPWEEDLDISIEEPGGAVDVLPGREPAYAEIKPDREPDG